MKKIGNLELHLVSFGSYVTIHSSSSMAVLRYFINKEMYIYVLWLKLNRMIGVVFKALETRF